MTTFQSNGHDGATDERIKRPALDRDAPRRSLNGLFNDREQPSSATASEAADPVSEVISSSVEAAYKLIEAQLGYGRAVAKQFGMSLSDTPLIASQPGSAKPPVLDPLFSAYSKGLTELSSMWFRVFAEVLAGLGKESLQRAAASKPAEPPAASEHIQAAEATEGKTDTTGPQVVIAIAIVPGGGGAVEAFCGDRDVSGIRVAVPRSSDRRPALGSFIVSEGTAPGRVRFTVHVPEGQAPGVYEGALYTAAGNFGMLSLTVAG